jgi:hypothetical protein
LFVDHVGITDICQFLFFLFLFLKTDVEHLCADRALASSYVFYFLLTSGMQSGGLL